MSEQEKGFTATPIASEKLPAWIWVALGALVVVALAVIFVLPRIVTEYELPLTRRPATSQVPIVVQSDTTPLTAISPFDEAQRARERAEAQDALASLLTQQVALDETGADDWAQTEYAEAVEFARLGDEAYRTQQFELARQNYQQADDIFRALIESIPTVIAQAVTEGNQALEQGDSVEAERQFTLALQLEPGAPEYETGLQRARTLDEVLRLLREGRRLQSAGQFQEAQEQFQQAVTLDSFHAASREALEQVRVSIADQDFAGVMSQGFAALQNNQPEQAITIFQRALSMRPNSQQAQEALTQTRDQIAVRKINQHQNAAREFEAAEQWQQAVAEYDAALAVDSNLVFATNGKDYAQKRAQLDLLLEDAIARPFRLAEPAVYEQTVGVYYAGRDLESPGPRLQSQLDTLENILREAQTPIEVELLSDNATEVMLYQIGSLGQFSSQVLSLTPGQYVAVGTRPGYRDVRKEFVVGFGNEPQPVTIQCNELVAVNRR